MNAFQIISEYYQNITGKPLTAEADRKDVELAITRATVGMEFHSRWKKNEKKSAEYWALYKELKKETYGTICDRLRNDGPGSKLNPGITGHSKR